MALTAERLREVLSYNRRTGIFYWIKPPWNHPRLKDREAGTPVDGYVYIQVDGVLYGAHRLAWLYTKGRWPADELDHRNRVRCDNRIRNLRAATHDQNTRNHSHDKRQKPSGLPTGVHHDPRRGRKHYQARIGFRGRPISLGYFDTVPEARAAYVAARRRLYGTFDPR